MKIALIVDSPHWAFHRIANQLVRFRPKEMQFTIIEGSFTNHEQASRLINNLNNNFDIVHTFPRYFPFGSGASNTTCVYNFEDVDRNLTNRNFIRDRNFYVSCQSLEKYYKKVFPNSIVRSCPDGVNEKLFHPKQMIKKRNKLLRIGWVGNPNWGSRDHKGYRTIVQPAIASLLESNLNIELVSADASKIKRNYLDMPEYYANIDLLVCASRTEGTPTPILEASSMALPWISTNVGIVPELTKSSQKFLLIKRNKSDLAKKIQFAYNNRDLISQIGLENRYEVEKNWTAKISSERIYAFFNDVNARQREII